MSIAISEDHLTLGETVADFLTKRDALLENRALLDNPGDAIVPFWAELAQLGWLGLHIEEEFGGSGYTLEELVVVVEELGRVIAPGAFVPTVISSAIIAAAADSETKSAFLPALADGTKTATFALDADLSLDAKAVSGSLVAPCANHVDLLLVAVGEDIAVIDLNGEGVEKTVPENLDQSRPSAKVTLSSAPTTLISGAAQVATDLARTILSAEAAGISSECTRLAAEYAKERIQFGRPIAMFQAVKHHCANMAVATELTTSAVWDAARAAAAGGEQFSYAAAVAATLAGPAADLCANLSTQVHGGIAITWEHDAHLYLRRATVLRQMLGSEKASADLTDLMRKGVQRAKAIELPPEAEPIRTEVREFVASVEGLDEDATKAKMIEDGYAMPHWPKPFGRAAGAIEQLVIEEEFKAAGIQRPSYGITGWNILTLIQYGTEDQVARWVPPALKQDVIWCQLFSEPDAGSDAAGVTTKATRTDGGWLINGQKVWTSGAHVAGYGFATVRTNPDVPKHQGITMVVIDMEAEGVEVRPIKMTTGNSEFNEVFFNDVFVPDDDVVGPVDGGWTVARSTLGNESVSIGGGDGGMAFPPEMLIPMYDAHPERLAAGENVIGDYIARHQAMGLMNLRSTHRAVAGSEPGPEGAITKLVLSELGHSAGAMNSALLGTDGYFTDGEAAIGNVLVLMHRALSIAGGTSEIKRNQIGERILGLPRDPLVK